jgi:crossover junction endodeoxyribonuclease RusA
LKIRLNWYLLLTTLQTPLKFTVTLPWPPSANTYWRRNGSRYFINPKGVLFRELVVYKLAAYRNYFSDHHRVSIEIKAYPPDRRRRDLDNLLKVTADSLQHAGIFKDDSQIDKILIERQPLLNGEIVLTVSEYKREPK